MAFIGSVTMADNRRTEGKPPGLCGRRSFIAGAGIGVGAVLFPQVKDVSARPEGVNRPELLPTEFTTVIDLEKFMTTGQRQRLARQIEDLEKKTGYKIRVLTQRFPQTPGLAIKDYWNVDDKTIVVVADYFRGTGSFVNFNVGDRVYDLLPPRYWTVLANKVGNKYSVEKLGPDGVIFKSTELISNCLAAGEVCVAPAL